MFWSDEIKDLKSLLGEIDTPAELAMALWLEYSSDWQSYAKRSNGYQIRRVRMISKCMDDSTTGVVDRDGNHIMGNDIRHIIRTGCSRRKATRFVTHKKIDYESYSDIAIDSDDNIYAIGYVNRDKTYHSKGYVVLDKYSSSGKLLWSRKITGVPNIKVVNGFAYLIENGKTTVKYTSRGKRVSFAPIKMTVTPRETQRVSPTLQVLSDEKKNIEISIVSHVVGKKGSIYVVGAEIFYPSGIPDGSAMCGNNGQVLWCRHGQA
jgi:hypothetical protein